MGIGAVERLAPAPARLRHAQHAAQQLLHRRGAGQLLQAAQHIGKRAVPALAQRLHCNHIAHRASARRQINVVQPALGARGHHDLVVWQIELLHQIAAQSLGRHFVAQVLRLKQHDGPHMTVPIGLVLQGLGLQFALRLHGAKHGGGPALGVLGQHDGQLDHVLGRQLLRADVVEHIGLGRNRRGRQLQNERGVQALQRGEALVRFGVVRLVHDEQGAVQCQPVGQAPARLAHKARQHTRGILRGVVCRHHGIGQSLQAGHAALWRALEVRLKALRKTVHIALARVLDAKALDGCHHHHGVAPPIGRGDLRHVVERAHLQALAIGIGQGGAVGMAGRLQGLERLLANGIAGHQPHGHRRIAALPLTRQQGHRVRRQHRFTAPRGNAQAHARHLRAKGVKVVGAARQLAKGQRRTLGAGCAGERAQRIEGGLLVGFEGDGGHGKKFSQHGATTKLSTGALQSTRGNEIRLHAV